jgi:hypothetical protein
MCAAGCAAARRPYPFSGLAHSVFSGLETTTEAELGDLYDRRVVLPNTPQASLVWLDDPSGVPLPEADRARLLEDVRRGVERPPMGRASVLPTTRVPGDIAANALDGLRSAAARFQSDVLVLLLTRTDTYNDWNLLSVTYVTVFPLFFIPGDDVSANVAAEACAVDVRTGVFLGCVQGAGDATRRFVTPLGKSARQRQLVSAATEDALRGLSRQMHAIIAECADRAGTESGSESVSASGSIPPRAVFTYRGPRFR